MSTVTKDLELAADGVKDHSENTVESFTQNNTTTEAPVIEATKPAKISSKKRWVVLLCLLLVALAIGLGVGLTKRNDNNDSSKAIAPSEEEEDSAAVDTPEDEPNEEFIEPEEEIPQEGLGAGEEVVSEEQDWNNGEPTNVDELQSGPPLNDLCVNAIPLPWNTSVVTVGTTALATTEQTQIDRYTGDFSSGQVDAYSTMCPDQAPAGVWYTVTGRGKGIDANTCMSKEPATIILYKGTVGNDAACALECVVSYFEVCGEGNSNNALSWFGEEGVEYFLYVTGSTSSVEPSLFVLQVTELESPVNDICTGAKTLSLDSTESVSTRNATPEVVDGYTLLDWEGDVLPGVFFNVVGTGKVMKISSPCRGNTDPRIYVVDDSDDCSRRYVSGEKAICEPDSEVYFETVAGQTYKILFQSASPDPSEVTLTEATPDRNDMCLGAIPLLPNSVTEGDTSTVRQSLYLRERRRLFSVAETGLFYTVVGTGRTLTASVPCDMDNFVGSSISVSSGVSCAEQGSVATIENLVCEPESFVSWETLPGVLYYIQVLPAYGSGPFTLTLAESEG